ncbi:MAG: hypothetical protein KF901_25495 [Myxococcales bacterium]|nr:hypothetical protein [Myxococcales bacterium]
MANETDEKRPEEETEGQADEGSAPESGSDELAGGADGESDEDGSDEDGSDDDDSDEDDSDEVDSDEDGSDEDGSDEDGSDEDGSDEDGSDEDRSRPAASTASSAAARARERAARGRAKKGKVTAGQRLAAAKAAKAAKKIAERGREAEVVEDAAIERAEVAGGWLEKNRKTILGMLGAVFVVAAVYFGYDAHRSSKAAEATQLLWEATEILNAGIRAEDADAPADEDEVTYTSIAARADAAIAKLEEVFAAGASADTLAWARLQHGRALYQKGQHAEARASFERALTEGNDDVVPRALEGVAFTYEAEEAFDEAVARFEQLRQEESSSLRILADYHLARMHLAREQEEPAKEKLQAVLEALREEDAPRLAYVRDQAELRLMAIDSSLVQRDAAMDPDEMRRLIEQLQRQQAAQ